MNWDQIEGSWKQLKGRVRERWGELTDDDIDRLGGSREQLVGLIQQRYGRSRDQVEREVDEWTDEVADNVRGFMAEGRERGESAMGRGGAEIDRGSDRGSRNEPKRGQRPGRDG